MRRGDIVLVTVPGDYGRRRPAVVVQTDLLNDTHSSVLVALITSDLKDAPLFRLTLEPGPTTGLRSRSQIMVDKVLAVRRDRIGEVIGALAEHGHALCFNLSVGPRPRPRG